MGKLTDILEADQEQMAFDELLAVIKQEQNPVRGGLPSHRIL